MLSISPSPRPRVLASLLSIALATGCAPIGDPTKDQVVNALSAILLAPEHTCDELRSYFRLDFLNPVETPDQAGLRYVQHWVATRDGNVLRVWWLPANLNRGTLVLSPGAAGDMACYLFPARLLVRNGWNVVLYDYEGFGQSTGSPNLSSLADDLETVVDWTRAFTGESQVTLMGISIGGMPSVAVAVRRPDAVNAVILDSPVALETELERFAFLLGGRLAGIIDVVERELFSELIIGAMHQPLLLFLSERDTVTSPAAIERLFDNAGGPKQLVRFPDLDHGLGPYLRTAEYTYHLDTFLADVWTDPTRRDAGTRSP